MVVTDEMRDAVARQRLGFVATVNDDGTPNLSPKGSVRIYGEMYGGDCLVFADIRSPRTVANIRTRPAVEVNVVDVFARRGFRFRGTAIVIDEGESFDRIASFLRGEGVSSAFERVVVVHVIEAEAVWSPAYDTGATEAEVRERWWRYWSGSTPAPGTDS